MAAPQYSADDYRQAFQFLLPRGRAWPRESDAVQTALADGLTRSYERQNADANYLLFDAFPATSAALLTEWEETLGLPDSCYRSSVSTVSDRQGQVVAKFAYAGGQTPQYFIDVAAKLGYSVTITQYTPARAGITRAGMPAYSSAWAFAWTVNGPTISVQYARAGSARAGDPLAVWGNSLLLCKLAQIAPAHTILLFNLSA